MATLAEFEAFVSKLKECKAAKDRSLEAGRRYRQFKTASGSEGEDYLECVYSSPSSGELSWCYVPNAEVEQAVRNRHSYQDCVRRAEAAQKTEADLKGELAEKVAELDQSIASRQRVELDGRSLKSPKTAFRPKLPKKGWVILSIVVAVVADRVFLGLGMPNTLLFVLIAMLVVGPLIKELLRVNKARAEAERANQAEIGRLQQSRAAIIQEYGKRIEDSARELERAREEIVQCGDPAQIEAAYQKARNEASGYYRMNLELVERRLEKENNKAQRLERALLGEGVLAETYWNEWPELLKLMKDGRADTVKEAVNLYEEERERRRHHAELEEQSRRQAQAAESQAAEAKRQAEAAQLEAQVKVQEAQMAERHRKEQAARQEELLKQQQEQAARQEELLKHQQERLEREKESQLTMQKQLELEQAARQKEKEELEERARKESLLRCRKCRHYTGSYYCPTVNEPCAELRNCPVFEISE